MPWPPQSLKLCLLLAWSAPLHAQGERFAPCEALVATEAAAVQLGSITAAVVDGALQLSGDGLFDGDGPRPAACTHPDGTGAVHAIASSGFGQCVVAAEHGLFVLDEAHPVADLADLRSGCPDGALLGVAPVGDGRLFVCTETQFGCVDLRHGYGFCFGAEQGVPPGPFLGVKKAGDAVVLQTRDGAFSYRPDAVAAPRPTGGEVERGERTVAFGERLQVAPPVDAPGPTRLVARRHHHHLLRPLVDGGLPGLRPGQHTVEVFALDQDLRRVQVGHYAVHVPLPAKFSTRWLPLAAAGAGLLVLLSAVPRRGRRRVPRALLRAGVFSVLGLQVLAALLGYGRSWPFMGFSMYTETYREGSLLYKPQVLGVRDDGGLVPLIDWDLGLRQDGYWQTLSELCYGDEDVLQHHLAIVAERRPQYGVTGLRFTDTRKRLTRSGPVDVAPVVVREWRQP